jgi:hypothetical protein
MIGEFRKLYEEAEKNVYIDCCEYHAHTFECLRGDPHSLTIIKLIDHIEYLEEAITNLSSKIRK